MGTDGPGQVQEMSFVIHLWLEKGERPAWRGRVTDVDGTDLRAFEDTQSLLDFIQDRLRMASQITLPALRSL